jgi:hypothetical protein
VWWGFRLPWHQRVDVEGTREVRISLGGQMVNYKLYRGDAFWSIEFLRSAMDIYISVAREKLLAKLNGITV